MVFAPQFTFSWFALGMHPGLPGQAISSLFIVRISLPSVQLLVAVATTTPFSFIWYTKLLSIQPFVGEVVKVVFRVKPQVMVWLLFKLVATLKLGAVGCPVMVKFSVCGYEGFSHPLPSGRVQSSIPSKFPILGLPLQQRHGPGPTFELSATPLS